MPLIDIRCSADHIHEVNRPLADYPATPACPTCGADTVQIHLPRQSITVDPIVVYRAPDGTFRFPGAREGRSIATYEAHGYQRLELRSAADMRRFESHMNARERSIMARKLERKQEAREQRESVMRSELRSRMASMSRQGRDLARLVMRANDRKPRERTADAQFHSEVYSFDRSNRDESRDSRGRRHRD